MGATPLLSTTDLSDWTELVLWLGWEQDKNRFALHEAVLPVVGYHPEDGCLFLFIALRWMQRPGWCGWLKISKLA